MLLYVIRHGETKANIEKRYLGQTDSPLTLLGQRQAEDLAKMLLPHNPEIIILSDLPRAKASAMPLIECSGASVYTDLRLRELNFGRIEGLTYTQAMESYVEDMKKWYENFENEAPPGGETLAAMRIRVNEFLSELVELPYKSAAIFTHGGVCNLLIAHATKQSFGSVWTNPGEMTNMRLTGTKHKWALEKL